YLMRQTKRLISREQSCLMTRCNRCAMIKTHARRGQLTSANANRLMSTHIYVHSDGVKKEREYVNSHFAKSECDPEYLHVTIDDMSNVATKLPHQIDSRAKLIPDSLLVRADLTAAVHAKKGSNGGHITDILLDVSNIYGSTVNST
ncbi:hypothetical protein PFISCL1PPCAC_20830, partial [Pristionchus fissidentatus]